MAKSKKKSKKKSLKTAKEPVVDAPVVEEIVDPKEETAILDAVEMADEEVKAPVEVTVDVTDAKVEEEFAVAPPAPKPIEPAVPHLTSDEAEEIYYAELNAKNEARLAAEKAASPEAIAQKRKEDKKKAVQAKKDAEALANIELARKKLEAAEEKARVIAARADK